MSATTAVVERDVTTPPSQGFLGIGLKRLAIYGAVSLAALGGIVYGYHWLTLGRFIESTDDAYVGGDITVIAPKVAG
ncbi:MAG: HlyD family secretion protein, partial [Gammaproteobacteria bacterium]|nr:HlyD family secretion protein [Gammaproteobacteria bacterium]